jgi:class 3 adenylate cyclase
VDVPKVRYAQNGGINIAYQVTGSGARDLLFVCGTCSHLALWWEDGNARRMLERLSSFGRLIIFDKPGTGMSDPLPAAPTIEQRVNDLLAVLDAAGSQRATIIGYSEGGLPATVLAATAPSRVDALVLLDSTLTFDWDDDLPVSEQRWDGIWETFQAAVDQWGTGILAGTMAPSLAGAEGLSELFGAIESACMSPAMARSVLLGYRGMDVRFMAPSVRVPTLVLHCGEDGGLVPRELGPDHARRIEGAVFKELRGADHFVWLQNSDLVPELIEEFLTGASAVTRDEDRILTTVVFTDIVDSTARLAGVGDFSWRQLLADLDREIDEMVLRYGGEAIKHTGDGRLVHFPRPARAVRFAAETTTRARRHGLEVRSGVHTGECESVNGDLIGLAVNIASRITDSAPPGGVLVSSTVKDLVVGSGLSFLELGEHQLKGVPGRWTLYRFETDRPGPLVSSGYDTDVRHAET